MDTGLPRFVTLDRAALYQEIWAAPAGTLARRYGISHVALARACRRHGIPRPVPGHWSKLTHGKPSPQAPLPAASDLRLERVTFVPGAGGLAGFRDPLEDPAEPRRPAEPKLLVPERLISPHLLVAAARRDLRGEERCDPYLGRPHSLVLAVFVSAKGLLRALRLLDALIKAWEAAGGRVTVDPDGPGPGEYVTHFRMADEQVPDLAGGVPPVPAWHTRPAWHRAAHPRYTGRFMLRLGRASGSKTRATWADGKRQRLDDRLEAVMAGLLNRIQYERQRRLDGQIADRQERQALSRRNAGKRRQAMENQRRQALQEDVGHWHYAQQIRAYVTACACRMARQEAPDKDRQSFAQWASWARWYADHVDPLVRRPPAPEKIRGPVNTRLAEIELTSRARVVLEALAVRDTDALYALSAEQIWRAEGAWSIRSVGRSVPRTGRPGLRHLQADVLDLGAVGYGVANGDGVSRPGGFPGTSRFRPSHPGWWQCSRPDAMCQRTARRRQASGSTPGAGRARTDRRRHPEPAG